MTTYADDAVTVMPFRDRHGDGVRGLNFAWIEKYFVVEDLDHRQLSDPFQTIIAPGGALFVAEREKRVVGTCAVLKIGAGHYELAKMLVAEDERGRGLGERLLDTALGWARENGAARVSLVSHSSLGPALNLYRKRGFRDIPIEQVENPYPECDVAMVLAISGG